MSELYLELSEQFYEEAEGICVELSKHLEVRRPIFVFRRAAAPTLPSFIQLLGDVAAWLPLSLAAKAFLAPVGNRAAEAPWENMVNRPDVQAAGRRGHDVGDRGRVRGGRGRNHRWSQYSG